MSDGLSVFDTPVGPLLARAQDDVLIELSFQVPTDGSAGKYPKRKATHEVLRAVEAQMNEYFARTRKSFDLPLRLRGPAFRRQVWEALCEIPYGHTVSYGDLASKIGCPDSARAVGAANGANPIAIIVPCHRVIGANGSLVGYGGGLRRKQILLDLESDAAPLALS